MNRRILLGLGFTALVAPCLASGAEDTWTETLKPNSGRNWFDEPRALAYTTVPIGVLFDLCKGARLEVAWSPVPADAVPLAGYMCDVGDVRLVLESGEWGTVEPGDWIPCLSDEPEFVKVLPRRKIAGSKR